MCRSPSHSWARRSPRASDKTCLLILTPPDYFSLLSPPLYLFFSPQNRLRMHQILSPQPEVVLGFACFPFTNLPSDPRRGCSGSLTEWGLEAQSEGRVGQREDVKAVSTQLRNQNSPLNKRNRDGIRAGPCSFRQKAASERGFGKWLEFWQVME